jgi:hypothetical protein
MWDGILIDRDRRSSPALEHLNPLAARRASNHATSSILLFGKRNSAFQPCCTMRPNPAPDSGTSLQRRTLHVGTAWSLDCAGLPSRKGIACSAFSVEPRLWSASLGTQRRHVSTLSSLCKGWDCGYRKRLNLLAFLDHLNFLTRLNNARKAKELRSGGLWYFFYL